MRGDRLDAYDGLFEHATSLAAEFGTFKARLGFALEAPSGEDLIAFAALRTSQAKVYRDHLERCRAIIGGEVVSVPDEVQVLVDDRATLIAALERVNVLSDLSKYPAVMDGYKIPLSDSMKEIGEIAREVLAKVKR